MTAENYFRKYETLCIYYKSEEKEKIKEFLSESGYPVPKKMDSPILLYKDKTISFISGFAMAILYSLPDKEFRKYRPNVKKIELKELSAPETDSKWYESRK